ncbi:MAG: glutaredoxin 3 [Gammaproteobacteria bacterium]|nr:glutaredoxin 3 [Gammaproteobacteria bacterium]
MKQVTIYTTGSCPYCTMAKRFLDKKGVNYTEIRVDIDSSKRIEMEDRSRRTSVPQIFVEDFHVGGFDDMQELAFDGELDELLGISKDN